MPRLSIPVLVLIALGIVTLLVGVILLRGQFALVHPLFGLTLVGAGLLTCAGAIFGTSKHTPPSVIADYKLVVCPNCHKETLSAVTSNNSWCLDCERKKQARLRIFGLTFLLAIALPVTLQLTRQNQDIRERASESVTVHRECDPGSWQPDSCSCGEWLPENTCQSHEFSRSCGNEHYCCQTSQNGKWECRLTP